MAYVDPPDATPAGTASSDAYNIATADIRDHESRILANTWMGTLAKRGTNQSIDDSTWTAMTFTSTEVDIGDLWTAGTDLTIPASWIPAGATTIAVEVFVSMRFEANGTGTRQGRVSVNGTPSDGVFKGPSLSSDITTVIGFDVVVVAEGDVITVDCYQDSGAALNSTGNRVLVRRGGIVS